MKPIMYMVIDFEFSKISSAFKRVKQDVSSIKNYIKDLYAKDQQKTDDIRKLQMEIEVLTKEIILIRSEKTTKTINKTIVEEEDVIGNSDSKMAHVESCPYGKKVTDDHRVFFKDKFDAKKQGYKFCVCMKD